MTTALKVGPLILAAIALVASIMAQELLLFFP